MSRLDPNIPISVKPPVPLQDLMMKRQGVRQDLEAQRQAMAVQREQLELAKAKEAREAEVVQLELRKKKQDMAEDEAINKAISESGGDIIKAYPVIVGINAAKANTRRDEYADYVKKTADASKMAIDEATSKLSLASQLMSSVKTNPGTLPHVKNMLKTIGFDDQDLSDIGDTYDPEDPADVARIDGLIERGLTESEKLARAREAADKSYQDELNRIADIKLSSETREINDRLVQFNPKTRAFDIDIGPAKKDQGVTPFEAWQRQNPNEPIETWIKLNAKYSSSGSGRSTFAERYIAEHGGGEVGEKAYQKFLAGNAGARSGVVADDMPTDYSNVIKSATKGITPGERVQYIDLANNLHAQGDTDSLNELIREAAVESEPVASQSQVNGRRDAMVALDEGMGLLKEMQAAGVPTNILRGTAEDVVRRLGESTNTKYVEFGNRMARALNAYTHAVSGAQFSEPEAARYARMFPDYKNSMPVNEALIKSLKDAMKTEDETFWVRKLTKKGAELVGAVKRASTSNTSSPESKPIVQRSPSTGAYRYSLDGGKTWHSGQPPSPSK